MATSTNVRRVLSWLVAGWLCASPLIAAAGPGFIDNARVTANTSAQQSTTAVEIRFNCKAEYLRHEPQGSGDSLRIYLDPTAVCNGVTPAVGRTQSRLRPLNAEGARLLDVEYDGTSPGDPVLTLNFTETVEFDVDMSSIAFGVIINVRRPESDSTNTMSSADSANPKVDALMLEARNLVAVGDLTRAIQLYTKVLQLPGHSRQPEAQEYLAVARDKNGQTAHAKAEYRRYLSLYPENDGADRVRQRLAVLLAVDRQANGLADTSTAQNRRRSAAKSDWRLQAYFSQYYRRDANQQNNEDQIVSQSALYSDMNLDARRRGERFDFSSRISAGYRNNFLQDTGASGNEFRVSYAYADLADASTGLRGRIGRQSRNTGGVLGRFDGINLGYEAGERLLLNAVVGKPAYSSSDGIDSARSFYGTSLTYGPILDDLELGVYFISQTIEGLDDRQAVGAEFRYFGRTRSIWGLVDYDTLYDELGSAFLQGSWRIASRLSLHGAIDRRHTPFLSAGNALIGQPVASFSELLEIVPEDEIMQLGFDRSPLSTTYTLGLSSALAPKLQISFDANHTSVEATPESGGVAATPSSTYSYYATSLVASSLLKEGDVTIFGARFSDSGTASVMSLTLDSRYPIGRALRINPRLRVDRRQRTADENDEWIYTPGIRIQYRRSQKFRIELEAGKQFSQREVFGTDIERESYFINVGYQSYF